MRLFNFLLKRYAAAMAKEFTGADWKAYSDFEFKWVGAVLTTLFSRENLLFLLDKLKIVFSENNWRETISTTEMGNVLTADIPRDELLPLVREIVKKSYPDHLSFEEAEQFYVTLLTLTTPLLHKLLFHFLSKKEIVEVIKKSPKEFEDKKYLLGFFLEELYRRI